MVKRSLPECEALRHQRRDAGAVLDSAVLQREWRLPHGMPTVLPRRVEPSSVSNDQLQPKPGRRAGRVNRIFGSEFGY